jgi:hypothetical protein
VDSPNPFTIPIGIVLVNQIGTTTHPNITKLPKDHCNPVRKVDNTGDYPISNPAAHLLCFPYTAAGQPSKTFDVQNQFGKATLTLKNSSELCLPTWKSLTGPPNKTPNQPPNLAHFTCYPVTVQSGSYDPVNPIQLQDQFMPGLQSAQVNATPSVLCLPTTKKVNNKTYTADLKGPHLLCFPVGTVGNSHQVWDENQFGTKPLFLGQTDRLCLPSTKTKPNLGKGTFHCSKLTGTITFNPPLVNGGSSPEVEYVSMTASGCNGGTPNPISLTAKATLNASTNDCSAFSNNPLPILLNVTYHLSSSSPSTSTGTVMSTVAGSAVTITATGKVTGSYPSSNAGASGTLKESASQINSSCAGSGVSSVHIASGTVSNF